MKGTVAIATYHDKKKSQAEKLIEERKNKRKGTKSEQGKKKKEEDSPSSTKQLLINPVNKNILETTKLLIKEMNDETEKYILKKYVI